MPSRIARGVISALLVIAAAACSDPGSTRSAAPTSTGCGDVIDEALFADAARLRELMGKVAGFGLRSTASEAHVNTINWLESELSRMPGMTLRSDSYELQRWQPAPNAANGPGRSMELAGKLKAGASAAAMSDLPVAGAVPYALPTGASGRTAPLVYLDADTDITAANAAGKIVVRDVPTAPLPYAAFAALSWYLTPDVLPLIASGNYDRPYLAMDGPMAEEIVNAGLVGVVGIIYVFNVPRDQVAGYFDPHRGTHFVQPMVFVGVDEGEQLKQLAAAGGSANIAVLAERDTATTRNLIATLPGQSAERVILSTNTDGNTWIQENGNAGLLALADYFSRRPLECRPRTIEFAFGSAHLHISKEGTHRYAEQINNEYDDGTVAYAFAIEHLGAKEILPAARTDGPGERLAYTGMGEGTAWFVGESPPLVASTIDAVNRRGLDRMILLRGQDVPNTARVPVHCSFGGIGTSFHSYLIPTMAIISGPWSLWAPTFGEDAVDFERMRSQLLAAGDVILASGAYSRETLAGIYPLERMLRDSGVPTCSTNLPLEQAPGPGA